MQKSAGSTHRCFQRAARQGRAIFSASLYVPIFSKGQRGTRCTWMMGGRLGSVSACFSGGLGLCRGKTKRREGACSAGTISGGFGLHEKQQTGTSAPPRGGERQEPAPLCHLLLRPPSWRDFHSKFSGKPHVLLEQPRGQVQGCWWDSCVQLAGPGRPTPHSCRTAAPGAEKAGEGVLCVPRLEAWGRGPGWVPGRWLRWKAPSLGTDRWTALHGDPDRLMGLGASFILARCQFTPGARRLWRTGDIYSPRLARRFLPPRPPPPDSRNDRAASPVPSVRHRRGGRRCGLKAF